MLLALLVVAARTERLTPAALGLGLPLGTAGWIGLTIAMLVTGALVVTTISRRANFRGLKRRPTDALMPEHPRERSLFLVMVPIIGFAWEVLYRGYLLWWLGPLIGLPLAVVIASMSYAFAHGWKRIGELGPVLGSALLFTTGYALTGSLWWLILLHIALPLIGLMAMQRGLAPAAEFAT